MGMQLIMVYKKLQSLSFYLRNIHAAHIVGFGLNLRNQKVKDMESQFEEAIEIGRSLNKELQTYQEFRNLLARTNPASEESNIGLEKIMDSTKYEVLKEHWDNTEITEQQLRKQVSFSFGFISYKSYCCRRQRK